MEILYRCCCGMDVHKKFVVACVLRIDEQGEETRQVQRFETYTEDADLTPMFAGLPDDQCQAAHWGYVIQGKLTFKSATGDETFETGDAYYVPPGHTPVLYAGTQVVEFSPTQELQDTLAVVERNMESAG